MTRPPEMDGAEPDGAQPAAAAPDGEVTRARPVSPRPSPAASAASRARRIGGRTAVTPAHRPTAAPTDDQDDRSGAADFPPVSTVKRPPAAAPADPDPDFDHDPDFDGPDPDPDPDPDADADVAASQSSDGRAATAVPEWLRWAPGAILIAGVVALAVLMAIVSHGVWWGGADSAASRNTARDQVTAAAKTCVASANTYKYTALPQFEASGAACTTGAFTAKFKSAVDTLIKPNAAKLKFSQTAQINKAAVESVADGQWTVLLFGQLSVTNVNTPKGRTDPFAAVVRMQRANGKWLIADLRTVS
ncbi:hypothetical protein [uncultured Jatrophihabitans sp.]|uniref:hypothetical protein n=1 Tax=uncultured Jatrophihabitans sp. TaxID=1610747 RepID=UPI0035CAE249